jgi:hypothetical protein
MLAARGIESHDGTTMNDADDRVGQEASEDRSRPNCACGKHHDTLDLLPRPPCGYPHLLLDAELGQLEPRDAARLWRTVVSTPCFTNPHDFHAFPEQLILPPGVLLRYDQFVSFVERTYGSDWHRFYVLDGEFSGRCVASGGPNYACDPPTFPATIEPVSAESVPG